MLDGLAEYRWQRFLASWLRYCHQTTFGTYATPFRHQHLLHRDSLGSATDQPTCYDARTKRFGQVRHRRDGISNFSDGVQIIPTKTSTPTSGVNSCTSRARSSTISTRFGKKSSKTLKPKPGATLEYHRSQSTSESTLLTFSH